VKNSPEGSLFLFFFFKLWFLASLYAGDWIAESNFEDGLEACWTRILLFIGLLLLPDLLDTVLCLL